MARNSQSISMNYSFRGFIEERFADEIKAAVEEFIEGDNYSDRRHSFQLRHIEKVHKDRPCQNQTN